jgi:hypothetical protein
VPTQVVAKAAREVVDALFFDQAVAGIVGKLIGGVILVDQGR